MDEYKACREVDQNRGHFESVKYWDRKSAHDYEELKVLDKDLKTLTDPYAKLSENNPTSSDKNSFLPDNSDSFLDNYFNNLNNFLDSLDPIQLLAFTHCSLVFVILSAFYTLLMIKFWDSTIEYFDLVNKYPKLAFVFKYRNKFKNYSILFNTILIIALLLVIFILNVSILFDII